MHVLFYILHATMASEKHVTVRSSKSLQLILGGFLNHVTKWQVKMVFQSKCQYTERDATSLNTMVGQMRCTQVHANEMIRGAYCLKILQPAN